MPSDLRHCAHCEVLLGEAEVGQRVHEELSAQLPPAMRADSERLSAWLMDLGDRFGQALSIRVIEPQSLLGFWRSVRHGIIRYPTFIVSGRKRLEGWDREALDRILLDQIGQQEVP